MKSGLKDSEQRRSICLTIKPPRLCATSRVCGARSSRLANPSAMMSARSWMDTPSPERTLANFVESYPTVNIRHVGKSVASHSSRSEEHTSELQSLMRISYADFCLKKTKTKSTKNSRITYNTATH